MHGPLNVKFGEIVLFSKGSMPALGPTQVLTRV